MAKRFETLDGMRGVCALIVVLSHTAFIPGAYALMGHGWLSVDVFFVLSGFVIALTYETRLLAGAPLKTFLAARWKRLVPVQLLGVLISWPFAVLAHWNMGPDSHALVIALLAAIFLVPISFTPAAGAFSHWVGEFPANPPIWSLLCEWLINIGYGAFLYRRSSPLLLGVAVAALVYLTAITFSPMGIDDFVLGIGRPTFGFVLGVLLCRQHRMGAVPRLPRINPLILYAAWFSISCVPNYQGFTALQAACACLVAALFVALFIRTERPMGRSWAFLGRLSYPLYASHFAVISFFCWIGRSWPSPAWAILVIPISLALAATLDFVTTKRAATSPSPASAP